MWDFNSQRTYTFRGFYIPPRMMDGLQRYIENHVAPGDFLTAILKNNLRDAVAYADDENLENLPAYVGFLYNECPAGCWGSEQLFKDWLANKGA
jgi:hypothetical protein